MIAFTLYPCCLSCNKRIEEMIWNETFMNNLFSLLLAFIIIAVTVVVLCFLSNMKYQAFMNNNPAAALRNPATLTMAAMVLGIGVGGFIDGILLHQLLQWHEMLTNVLPPVTLEAKSVNMFWDGIFHSFTLIITLMGIALLWRVMRRRDIDTSARMLFSGMLRGWAIFNITEGTINHHVLKLHNVRENVPDPEFWNYGFLGISALLFIAGYYFSNYKYWLPNI